VAARLVKEKIRKGGEMLEVIFTLLAPRPHNLKEKGGRT